MSKLIDGKITINEAMQNIKSGKYVIPAFQRKFVWDMNRIEKLWDSILLDYPISHFLFWHLDETNTTWDTYFLQFLNQLTFSSKLTANGENNNYDLSSIDSSINDTAVLDGQQRLTSLFVSLYGNMYLRPKNVRRKNSGGIVTRLYIELNKNNLNPREDDEEYNSKTYDIKFTNKVSALSPSQFEIRNILDEKYQNEESRAKEFNAITSKVPENSREYALEILKKLYSKIYEEELIKFVDIYDMKEDDALEMFVRFNSGGKALKKSEHTMSLIVGYWPQARAEFGKLLSKRYTNFDTDFIVRTALLLYGDVIKSNINKRVVVQLKDNWSVFKKALDSTEELLKSFNVDINRFAKSWNILLPIIYFIYYNPSDYLNNKDDVRAYLIRGVLFKYFQSGTTAKLQQMKTNMGNFNYRITVEMLEQIPDLRVTDARIEDILNSEKDSRIAKETLYYLSKDWIKPNLKYEQDHLHPYDRFDKSMPFSIKANDWQRWRTVRNRLPNLWLLEGRSNGGKLNTPLADYYDEMTEDQKAEFVAHALLPTDTSYDFENFENFYKKRKDILKGAIEKLLQ